MLLAGLAEAAGGNEPGAGAFRAGYQLLTRLRAAGAGADIWLLGLPHMGAWTHACHMDIVDGKPPDFGHFAGMAAAAAIRVGFPFELDVPVREGRVRLPGLGVVQIAGEMDSVTILCDGDHVTVGDQFKVDYSLIAPDYGSAKAIPHWSGTPALRATADRLTWDVLLETEDPYLDRYTRPMYKDLQVRDLRRWRHRTQLAWAILVRHHRWAAEPLADAISVIVPLREDSDTELVSATTPAVFGAIATSWPPDPVTMAETLVHEFQHVKLGALMEMVQLVESSHERVYAPWRADPRPADALLQGAYAHLGIVRFWGSQRDAELDPDSILRAQAQFARWRSAIERAVRTLIRARCLTPTGLRFVRQLYTWEKDLVYAPIPSDAKEMAAEAALDHWLTWQIRHVAIDDAGVESLAAAYQRGEPFSEQLRPTAQIVTEEIRTVNVNASTRSRLLTMRYLAPTRCRDLLTNEDLLPDEADVLLVNRKSKPAVQAYCDQIARSPEPQPEAWIGLALALHQLPASPFKHAFGTQLALMYELHRYLSDLSDRRDPLDLAGWLQ